MILHLVRHAKAAIRSDHVGSDRGRPLVERGELQAKELAVRSMFNAVSRIMSSPAVRCIETVRPLAERLGLVVEEDERLNEGQDPSVVFELAAAHDLQGGDIVLCSHGDLIPEALHLATMRGVELIGPALVEKASTWSVVFDRDRPLRATRAAAPR